MTRSRQTSLDIGRCHHDRRETLRSEGGDPIAIRCTGCTLILAHYGRCDGCGKGPIELYCLVATRKKRFCESACFERWKEARRKAKNAGVSPA